MQSSPRHRVPAVEAENAACHGHSVRQGRLRELRANVPKERGTQGSLGYIGAEIT